MAFLMNYIINAIILSKKNRNGHQVIWFTSFPLVLNYGKQIEVYIRLADRALDRILVKIKEFKFYLYPGLVVLNR